MASLTDIRSAIKTTIENSIAVKVYDTIPDSLTLPAVVVKPVTADFTVAMGRGADTYEFDLLILVSVAEVTIAQHQLDSYVNGAGANSIRQVIFTHRSLGLTDTDAHISALTAYDIQIALGNLDHIGATLRLTVHTAGDSG